MGVTRISFDFRLVCSPTGCRSGTMGLRCRGTSVSYPENVFSSRTAATAGPIAECILVIITHYLLHIAYCASADSAIGRCGVVVGLLMTKMLQ